MIKGRKEEDMIRKLNRIIPKFIWKNTRENNDETFEEELRGTYSTHILNNYRLRQLIMFYCRNTLKDKWQRTDASPYGSFMQIRKTPRTLPRKPCRCLAMS